MMTAAAEARRLITAHAEEIARLASEPHWGREENNRLGLVREAQASLGRALELGAWAGLTREEMIVLQTAAGLTRW